MTKKIVLTVVVMLGLGAFAVTVAERRATREAELWDEAARHS